MDNIIGKITSRTTGRIYLVKWDPNDHSSWISEKESEWTQVCTNVRSAEEAIICAK